MNAENTMAKNTDAPYANTGGRRKRKGRRRQGGDASDYAIQVYGNRNEQQSQQGGSTATPHNTTPASSNTSDPFQKGGNNQIQMNQVRGGTVLNDIAVPAALLYANHAYGKYKRNPYLSVPRRTFRRRGSRKNRRSRRRR